MPLSSQGRMSKSLDNSGNMRPAEIVEANQESISPSCHPHAIPEWHSAAEKINIVSTIMRLLYTRRSSNQRLMLKQRQGLFDSGTYIRQLTFRSVLLKVTTTDTYPNTFFILRMIEACQREKQRCVKRPTMRTTFIEFFLHMIKQSTRFFPVGQRLHIARTSSISKYNQINADFL